MILKKSTLLLLILGVSLLFTNCASIISDSMYGVAFSSAPSKATIEIINSTGSLIFKGTTPVNIRLSAKEGFFKKARYSIRFSKEGYDDLIVPLTARLDGWYIGNLAFSSLSLIGFLVVDPITGAMFKLNQEFINVSLSKSIGAIDEFGFQLVQLDEIPEQWLAQLEQIY